jgi:hypothetical protein
MDGDEIRVPELGCRSGFAQKAPSLPRIVIGKPRDFERHAPIHDRVVSEIDLSVRSFAEEDAQNEPADGSYGICPD